MCENMSFLRADVPDFSPPQFLVPSTAPDMFSKAQ